MPTYTVYGIALATDFPFRWPLRLTDRSPDLRFESVATPPIDLDWHATQPVHAVSVGGDEDRPDIAYHAFDGLDVVRIRDVADHYLWPDRIVCHLKDPAWTYLAEIQLLGMVLALWLERRGVPTLHASAVVVDGAAVAFMGAKGGGKTTAATGLIAGGHSLLADDLLALRFDAGRVLAAPGYPMLRLWPTQADHFVGDHERLPLVHPAYTKRRISIPQEFGRFHPSPAPLRRLYVPQRSRGAALTITPMRSRDAVIALVRESFLRDAVHGLGLAPGRLSALAQTVRDATVCTIRYPDGFDRLPELVTAVEEDLAAG